MLGDGEDTPTRFELLSMVKKHSKLLGKTTVDEEDASDVEMDSCFWHDVMDLYFIRGRESRGRQDDDLVFFVKKLKLHGHVTNDDMQSDSPYFVRRWAPKLDDLVSKKSADVDWRRSLYLNLIAHSTFSVTVAICRIMAFQWIIVVKTHKYSSITKRVLTNHQSGQDAPLSSIYKVVKTVYASPSRVDFHLDSTKEVETTPAYPDICFAVDDFDSTFDAVVLTDTDHCYCVLLNIDGGAAFPVEKTEQGSSSNPSPKKQTGKTKKTKITLFSGFVSYQMVRDAYEAGRSGFGSLLSLGNSSNKTDRIYMKGPGGRGEVEVAVSGVIDQSKEGSSPPSPGSKKALNFGRIVRRAASVASVAAKHAIAAASSSPRAYDEQMLPLKCGLMSVSLPWEHIAHDLLFKGGPPVNL